METCQSVIVQLRPWIDVAIPSVRVECVSPDSWSHGDDALGTANTSTRMISLRANADLNADTARLVTVHEVAHLLIRDRVPYRLVEPLIARTGASSWGDPDVEWERRPSEVAANAVALLLAGGPSQRPESESAARVRRHMASALDLLSINEAVGLLRGDPLRPQPPDAAPSIDRSSRSVRHEPVR